MKWFKHDSNASTDAKLEKLLIRYGMEGYGLYWYCLELIASQVEKHNLTFELEHDAEVIAHRSGIHIDSVHEMMAYMVDINLFENDRGVITCLKMAKRTDEYTQKLLKTRATPDKLPTLSGQNPEKSALIEQKRTEEKRTNKPKTKKGSRLSMQSLPDEWEGFCRENRPDLHPHSVFEQFKDYWAGVAGAKGVKLDWLATWRNWVRNQKGQNNGSHQQGNTSRAKQVSDKLDEIARRDIAENGFTSSLG